MSRYIDADEFADRLLNAWHTNDKKARRDITEIIDCIVTPLLIDTPTADVKEIVRGEWIMDGHSYYKFRCPNCYGYQAYNMSYCPNCGADMRGGDMNGENTNRIK